MNSIQSWLRLNFCVDNQCTPPKLHIISQNATLVEPRCVPTVPGTRHRWPYPVRDFFRLYHPICLPLALFAKQCLSLFAGTLKRLDDRCFETEYFGEKLDKHCRPSHKIKCTKHNLPQFPNIRNVYFTKVLHNLIWWVSVAK